MSQQNQEPNESEESVGGEVQENAAAGSEATNSDPAPQGEELTVEDILNSEQTDEAGTADEQIISSEPTEGAEYLEDLRRITAEFANYRKRIEDNREIERQRITASAISSLVPVLDDLERADKHGDLVEGSAFSAIAQKIRSSLERLGLSSFGAAGEDFDPNQHEAITQVPTPGVEKATVLEVVEPGYRIGDVEVRAAKVVVAVPIDG